MFRNCFLVVIGVISVLLMTMAVSSPRPKTSLASDQSGGDFYQHHLDWTWIVRNTVDSSLSSDYFMRHPELSTTVLGLGASDYFFRHR